MKHKRFKCHKKDLIRHACKCAIHRQDVEIPARMGVITEDHLMRHPVDFLKQCAAKLRMPR